MKVVMRTLVSSMILLGFSGPTGLAGESFSTTPLEQTADSCEASIDALTGKAEGVDGYKWSKCTVNVKVLKKGKLLNGEAAMLGRNFRSLLLYREASTDHWEINGRKYDGRHAKLAIFPFNVGNDGETIWQRDELEQGRGNRPAPRSYHLSHQSCVPDKAVYYFDSVDQRNGSAQSTLLVRLQDEKGEYLLAHGTGFGGELSYDVVCREKEEL